MYKNILYFAFVSSKYGGVEQKILSQFDALSVIRKNVFLFLISSETPGKTLQHEAEIRENVSFLINSKEKIINPLARRKEKFGMILNVLPNFNPSETICYFRYPNADFLFLNFLKRCRNYTIITEHQEIENTFTKRIYNGNYLRNSFELIWGHRVRSLINGFVGVTPEITEYQVKTARSKDKYWLTNGNGIDVNHYPLRLLNQSNQNEIKIVFVGAGYRTHGLHRLLYSISNYSTKKQTPIHLIKLRIAGDSQEMNRNKKLANALNITNHVEFLGHSEAEKLDELYNWADVAVGSLGLHRVGLEYSSTLKAREYYSRGIPFFWSTKDVDLPNNSPWVLEFEANEKPIDMSAVIQFVLETREYSSHPEKMRQYSLEHLDWSKKMQRLVTFFDLGMNANMHT